MERGFLRRATCGVVLAVSVAVPFRPSVTAAQEADEPEKGGGYLDYLNTPHAWFSRRLGNLSRQIDSYFGSSTDVYNEISGTYVEVELAQQLAEAGSSETDADFQIKVELPRTEQRLDLLLESVREELDPRDDNAADRSRRTRDDDSPSGIFAGLRRVFVDTTGLQVSADAGVKVRTPPEPFARTRLRQTWPLGEWQLRFKETLYWFDSDGAGQTTEIDLDRWLSERFALRTSGRYRWRDETDEWRIGHGVSLFQILDRRNSLAYEAGVQASNRPLLRSEQYRLGLRFRRRLHRDWLFLSLVPDVIWRRERDFRPEPGLRIELEALLGERYLGVRRGRDAP